MRILASLPVTMLFAGALFGQPAGARSGAPSGSFHGGGYHLNSPGLVGSGYRAPAAVGRRTVIVPYAYPVYIGSGYYPSDYTTGYADGSYAPAPPPQSVMVVVPQQPDPAMVSQFGNGAMPPPGANAEPVNPYEPSTAPSDDQANPDHYLIALKDHSIYWAVAYWVDGDTLHYFTAGNVHNQASLSLVDRDLTARLNKESGTQFSLPPAK